MERFALPAELEQGPLQTEAGRIKRWQIVAIGAGLIGISLRLVVAATTVGSNDIVTWEGFARSIRDSGLLHMYREPIVPGWNHPPLAALVAGSMLRLADASSIPFRTVFKVPVIAADAAVLILLWRRISPRTLAGAALAVMVFALSPDAILVSAYHGNTDPILGMFILASAVAHLSGRPFLAGIGLGAAANIKLMPLMLVPILLGHQRSTHDFLRCGAGLATAVLPFLPVLATSPRGFLMNVAGYSPQTDNWGVPFIVRMIDGSALTEVTGAWTYPWLEVMSRCLIFGGPALVAWLCVRNRWHHLTAAYALSVALFLVAAPGFGVQYTAIVGPILTAYSWKWGAVWGVLSGVFLALVYWHFWTGNFPPFSHFRSALPLGPSWLGLAAWACLLVLILTNYRAVADESHEAL